MSYSSYRKRNEFFFKKSIFPKSGKSLFRSMYNTVLGTACRLMNIRTKLKLSVTVDTTTTTTTTITFSVARVLCISAANIVSKVCIVISSVSYIYVVKVYVNMFLTKINDLKRLFSMKVRLELYRRSVDEEHAKNDLKKSWKWSQ